MSVGFQICRISVVDVTSLRAVGRPIYLGELLAMLDERNDLGRGISYTVWHHASRINVLHGVEAVSRRPLHSIVKVDMIWE